MGPVGRVLLALCLALALSGCSWSKFRTYSGPEVTRIVVHKADRSMTLYSGPRSIARYDVALGRNPVGQKRMEGDGRTPEGHYIIDRRNPNSRFHLSLGISYPEVSQRKAAKEAGLSPGGDIFIHGEGNRRPPGRRDWTEGCIAVTDDEMEEIYAMVRVGTRITILP
jgi:murein L,D-transpeptidase YafK